MRKIIEDRKSNFVFALVCMCKMIEVGGHFVSLSRKFTSF